jgi:hypothetical protein
MLKPGSFSEKGVTRTLLEWRGAEFRLCKIVFLEKVEFPLTGSVIKLSRPKEVSLGPFGLELLRNSASRIATLKKLAPVKNFSVEILILTSIMCFHPFGRP